MATQSCRLPSGVVLNVRIDDFSDPWVTPPAVLMLHGTAETHEAWRGWTPWLARQFRVVAPDLRGMGGSSGVVPGTRLELDDLVQDAHALMQSLGLSRYYVVGEKLGALVGLALAAAHPQAVQGAALACGMVSPAQVLGPWLPEWARTIGEEGARAWVDATQGGRMGEELPPEGLEWWSTLMARSAPPDVLRAYLDLLSRLTIGTPTLQAIRCPVLFLVPAQAEPSDGRYDQRRPRAEAEAWRAHVAGHRVAEIPSASYHLAATRPDACAVAARDFFLGLQRTTGAG